MGFLDKAKEVLHENAEKVEAAIDKAGDIIDEKTQGKFKDTVDKVQDAAKSAVASPTTRHVNQLTESPLVLCGEVVHAAVLRPHLNLMTAGPKPPVQAARGLVDDVRRRLVDLGPGAVHRPVQKLSGRGRAPEEQRREPPLGGGHPDRPNDVGAEADQVLELLDPVSEPPELRPAAARLRRQVL